MKKIFIVLVMMLSLSLSAQNFTAPIKEKIIFTDTITTYTYQINNKIYPVFKSKSMAFYIWKVSKAGKKYKYYLPKEIQIQMGRVYKISK